MWNCLTGGNGDHHGCILADYMGLGKTLQTLALTMCLLQSNHVKQMIVLCTKTLLGVWKDECHNWLGNKLVPSVAFGEGKEVRATVKRFANGQNRMLVMHYHQFTANFSEIKKANIDLLIMDEGHHLKSLKIDCVHRILSLRCRKRLLLSGTLLQNNLKELYTLMSVVNPGILGNP